MSWVVRVAEDAQAFVDGLPKKVRSQISRNLTQMEQDPFHGDVKALQGASWQGCYRKRAGDYRIIFAADRTRHCVDVFAVLLRSEKTYRSGK